MTKKTHAQEIAERCVKAVRKEWGQGARQRLGGTLFQALVAREVVSLLWAQHVDEMSTDSRKAAIFDYVLEVSNLAMAMADPADSI